ncbi:hypothetical protein JMK10_17920 [Rhodovulum sulfidophilum]|uniref:hypothetical protein n=1 Tax=Rhodovulum sulfidophilum TaxID=35806 RepID=UPI0019242008|nr:hypothetical protein [Rhodovulum sulfidophilum]MBL3575539.1 hypothetical protein [Rhodovulum sulfidophilum]MCE8431815.1 hypothetical protein [Rhodovulum sulfidophilum]MCF4118629.1 hypothetical protein [Rhodovulum sulfidophilum]
MTERVAFDPANILPVTSSANRSKGSRGPLDWLPPDRSFFCQYVLRFRRVAASYGLGFTIAKKEGLAALIRGVGCERSRRWPGLARLLPEVDI